MGTNNPTLRYLDKTDTHNLENKVTVSQAEHKVPVLCGASIVWLGSGKTKPIVEMWSSKFLVELACLLLAPQSNLRSKCSQLVCLMNNQKPPPFPGDLWEIQWVDIN